MPEAPNPLIAEYLSRPEFCEMMGITARTASLWKQKRLGPPVTIIARRAYYHVDDVKAYLAQCRDNSQSRTHQRRAA